MSIIDLTKSWQEQTPKQIPKPDTGGYFITWDWSPDGKKLVGRFGLDQLAAGIFSFETNSFKRVVEKVDTIPAWLADSRRFVYAFEDKIFLDDSETGRIKELLTIEPESPRSSFVSRDGKLLYYTAHSGKSDIWLLDNSLQNQ